MRLKTIWTLPSMSMAERFRRTFDWGALATARRLPKRVRYWATMTEISKATRDSSDIMATPLDQVLKKLEGGPK